MPQIDRTPLTRRGLYACLIPLALMALLNFDLLLLVPITIVLGVQYSARPSTVFGRKRPQWPAGEPRSTHDPLVRVHLVMGGFLLLAGLITLLGFPFAASPAGTLMGRLPSWLFRPGVQALLLGGVITALGFDFLQGGLGRPRAEPPPEDTREPALHVSVVLSRYVAPWVALAALAYWGTWPLLAQAVVALIGLAILRRLAPEWPIFAALAAPAVAFYGWSSMGHTGRAAGPANPLLFAAMLVLYLIGLGLVPSVLGRAVTGLLDVTARRTRVPAPWFQQIALGLAACALVFGAHTQLLARTARLKAAEVAEREARFAAADRAAAEKRAEAANDAAKARARAAAERAEADAVVPGLSCHFETHPPRFVFEYQHPSPKPGSRGPRNIESVSLVPEGKDVTFEARALDAKADLHALRHTASTAPILRLPAGEVVFLSPSPTGAQLHMLQPDGRVLRMGGFHEALLRYAPPVGCANESGSNWAVAMGPVVIVFERPAPEANPRQVRQYALSTFPDIPP